MASRFTEQSSTPAVTEVTPVTMVGPRRASASAAFDLLKIAAVIWAFATGPSIRHRLPHGDSLVDRVRTRTRTRHRRWGRGRGREVGRRVRTRRQLWSLSSFLDPKSVTRKGERSGGDPDPDFRPGPGPGPNATIAALQLRGRGRGHRHRIPDLAPYDNRNAMIAPRAFRRELFLVRYDPAEDAFLLYVDEAKDPYASPAWSPVFGRLNAVMPALTRALRTHFPRRFRGAAGGSPEFVVFASTGDTPKLSCECVRGGGAGGGGGGGGTQEGPPERHEHCRNDEFAPVLQFGSVYKDAAILPNVVTMPVWTHMACFAEWQEAGRVCEDRRARADAAGILGAGDPSAGDRPKQMPFPAWDALIPTLVWRGSDYYFLKCL
ncbi:hypothetical protein ACHAWF_003647 [Thalassiosira exigua]